MEKIFVCSAFLCLFFLSAIQGCLAGGKWQENAVVKQCEQDIKLVGCDDSKCFAACQQQFQTIKSAFCLPSGQACQCYYTCDKGPIAECSENIKLEGCDNSKCFRACTSSVKGAVSGTCLPGNHTCECDIPCAD